jgi:hypothetical protein
MQNKYWWESQKERYHSEDQVIGRCILLRWISRSHRIGLAQDRDQWRASDHGNEPSGSVKCWEVFDQLQNWQPLLKGSAAWN